MKFFAFILILLSCLAYSAQDATVVTDGAMVYKQSNFDSHVIGYMRSGRKVRISSRVFGGAFYRVQFSQGVLGYIADSDIQIKGNNKVGTRTSKNIKKSFITKTYLGLSLGMLNYSELFNKAPVSQMLYFYGVKLTLPFRFLSGPFVFDTSLLYHQGYPNYYNTPSSRGESGKIALWDASLLYSFYESRGRSFWLYFGAGPLISYSSFVVEVSSSKMDLTESQFGGVLTAGGALKLGPLALKFEPKYYFLKSSFFGFLGSLQYEF